MDNTQNLNTDINAYKNPENVQGKSTNAIMPPDKNIDVDINHLLFDNILAGSISSKLDISKLQSFTQISNNRETVMQLLDTMAEDAAVSSVLEIYTEDATEVNDEGRIVWCVSDDSNIMHFVNFLLDTMSIDKNIYKWTYSLCKYGDLYLRLFRESDYEDVIFKPKSNLNKKQLNESVESLNEDVIIKAYDKNDHYSHYVEMVANPAEMFELTKYGKTYGYIKANIASQVKKQDANMTGYLYKYSFNKKDVEIYDATSFVHAALQDECQRAPEEVELFIDDSINSPSTSYNVNKGQSLLYNSFKLWREMNLLENSILLNRITKSSIVRIVGVQVGDMPKEQVGPHLMSIKQLMEQKSALDVGMSMEEYTNPGPIENNIYVPIHGDVGSIKLDTIGGDVNVTGLADLDYFKNKLSGAWKIPKQYLGWTEDSTGFNGGTALSLISSRYAKSVKRIQNTMIQAITDAVNLMLIDKNLDSYIGKFTLKMQYPTTQEEVDRRNVESDHIRMIQDIMQLIDGTEIEDASSKLKILKSLLSSSINDPEIMAIIQDEIDKMEQLENQGVDTTDDELRAANGIDSNFGGGSSGDISFSGGDFDSSELDEPIETSSGEEAQENEPSEDNTLPTPAELDAGDFTDFDNANLA